MQKKIRNLNENKRLYLINLTKLCNPRVQQDNRLADTSLCRRPSEDRSHYQPRDQEITQDITALFSY